MAGMVQTESATLYDYGPVQSRSSHSVIAPKAGSALHGFVIYTQPGTQAAQVDQTDTSSYERVRVHVHTPGGHERIAHAYVRKG